MSFVTFALCVCGFVFPVVAFGEPTLEVSADVSGIRVEQPFEVRYEVTWTGAADAYAVEPQEVEPVDWAESRTLRTESGIRDEAFYLAQTVEFTPSEAGDFEVPQFLVAYFDPAELPSDADLKADAEDVEPPVRQYLKAESLPIHVGAPLGPYLTFGGVLALIAGLTGIGLYTMRQRRLDTMSVTIPGVPIPKTVQSVLNLARQHRLDGRFYEFYRELARGAELLAPSVAAKRLREKLESEAQNVGYRGEKPSDDEMDGALKDLERAEKSSPKVVE